ncbi:MAG: chromate efflux transporter [Pseudobdellovibrio sp.]
MKELAFFFLKLGLTGFGGPLVLIQQMREHYVDEEQKITGADFDQAFALVKAMPGPVAFQMAAFLGQRFYGFLGAVISGVGLILPAFVIMILTGIFYESFVTNSYVAPVLDGLLYSASAVILMSLKGLISTNQKYSLFWIFLAINVVLQWFQVLPEPVLIISFGLLALLYQRISSKMFLFSVGFFFIDWNKIYELGRTCLYAGAVVFGTGFALLPVLKTNLVDVHQLINIKQFSDGVVFGQMTPGPITITVTFLGYQISGFTGALVGTICVFFMPFVHMATWFPLAIGWMSRQKWINQFVMGATSAVVAGIILTVVHMNEFSKTKPLFWVIFFATLGWLQFRSKTSVFLIFILAGAFNLLAMLALGSLN